MKKIELNELKTIQLSILDDIDAFCIHNNIRYSLCGGTMLGAVRHMGYIPWDDDIDLMMPRSDYERFKKTYQSEENIIIDLSKSDCCVEQFIKVSRIGTMMEDVVLHSRLWGVNVDIFPVDGMPEEYIPYTDSLRHIHDSVVRSCLYYKAATRNKLYWFARYLIKRLTGKATGNVNQLKHQLNDIALKHLPEKSPLSTVIYGDFKIFTFPSHIFFECEPVSFEGKNYQCIKERHLYLSTVYNDYMTLPPKEKQVTHHLYDSYYIDR